MKTIDIGENGIGSAESQQGRLGEKPAQLPPRVLPAESYGQGQHGQQPERATYYQHAPQAPPGKMCVYLTRPLINQRQPVGCGTRIGKDLRRQTADEITGQRRCRNNGWKWQLQGKDG
jgi:hypothetical protein